MEIRGFSDFLESTRNRRLCRQRPLSANHESSRIETEYNRIISSSNLNDTTFNIPERKFSSGAQKRRRKYVNQSRQTGIFYSIFHSICLNILRTTEFCQACAHSINYKFRGRTKINAERMNRRISSKQSMGRPFIHLLFICFDEQRIRPYMVYIGIYWTVIQIFRKTNFETWKLKVRVRNGNLGIFKSN